MVTSQRDANIDRAFPFAASDGYQLRSPQDPNYNCIAWAASLTNIVWWPTPFPIPGSFWPDDAPREETLSAFMRAYATIGYEDCGTNGALEPGFERIVLFATADGKLQHAARQLSDGVWTSKLGRYKDIHHTTPGAVETDDSYGRVVRYMRRERKPWHMCLRTPEVIDA